MGQKNICSMPVFGERTNENGKFSASFGFI